MKHIAGSKVYLVLEDVDCPGSENYDLAPSHADIFAVSFLTRAQAPKQAQDVDLSDSFFV